MITKWLDNEALKIWNMHVSKKLPPDIQLRVRTKLIMIDAALSLNDLRAPPSNMLEALHGKRKGQYSIRVNDKWRICFIWNDAQVTIVDVVDYH